MEKAFILLKSFCFLFAFWCTATTTSTAQQQSAVFRFGANFTKPAGNAEFEYFEPRVGWNTLLTTRWSLNESYSLDVGITFNKIIFDEVITNLIFPQDVIQNTRTTLFRTVRFYETGGVATVSRKFNNRLKNLSPFVGVSVSKLFGRTSAGKKSGNGEITVSDNFKVPNYLFNFYTGINWNIPLNKKNGLGVEVSTFISPQKVSSPDSFSPNSFHPNRLNINMAWIHKF